MQTADLQHNSSRVLHGNVCFTDAGLTIGTTTSKLKTANTTTVSVNGKFASDGSGTDNISFSSGHDTLPAGYTQLIVLALAADGSTYSTYQGRPFKSETDVEGNTVYRGYTLETIGQAGSTVARKGGDLEEYTSAFLPTDIPDTVTPVGVVKIVNATNDFVFGTTGLDASGVTDTYTNISVLPSNYAF
jgi:hypothetical protein